LLGGSPSAGSECSLDSGNSTNDDNRSPVLYNSHLKSDGHISDTDDDGKPGSEGWDDKYLEDDEYLKHHERDASEDGIVYPHDSDTNRGDATCNDEAGELESAESKESVHGNLEPKDDGWGFLEIEISEADRSHFWKWWTGHRGW